ncbi:MAG: hypothetical protein WD627_07500 [Actinomycetota bacterium]
MPLTPEEQSRLRLAFHRTGLSVQELADEAGVTTSLVEMMLGFRGWSAVALHPAGTGGMLLKSRYTKLLENARDLGRATKEMGRDGEAEV